MQDEPKGGRGPEAREDVEKEPTAEDRLEERFPERPVFQHPQWLLGVVLVFAVVAIFAGLRDPVWLLIGFPAILVLAVWIWVQYRLRTM